MTKIQKEFNHIFIKQILDQIESNQQEPLAALVMKPKIVYHYHGSAAAVIELFLIFKVLLDALHEVEKFDLNDH